MTTEKRWGALDTLRGMSVAGMILVDSPGAWSAVYPPLEHADWHGWTVADMVFPGFLIAMGMATQLALPKRIAAGVPGGAIARQVLVRALLLIVIGLVLNGFPDYDLANIRLPGILQRIALCYVAVAGVVLLTADAKVDARGTVVTGAVAAVLLVGYWALLALVPVPGFGAGRFDSFGSWPAFADRHMFTIPHLWIWGTTDGHGVTFDPEGLLSTVPAIATTLLGVLAARVMRAWDRTVIAIAVLAAAGAVLLAAGLALDPVVPIVKKIWTPSFALVSGGFVVLVFAATALVEDVWGARRWSVPFRVLGSNAILAFILCQLNDVLDDRVKLAGGALRDVVTHAIQTVVPDGQAASLVFALGTLLLFVLLLWPLHARRLFLRL